MSHSGIRTTRLLALMAALGLFQFGGGLVRAQEATPTPAPAQGTVCRLEPALAAVDSNGDGIATPGEIREFGVANNSQELIDQANALEAQGVTGIQYRDCTPDTDTGTDTGTDHPAHIHAGTCDNLGDVVFPLENATAQPPATPVVASASGAETAEASSTTIVDASLDDILAEEHAINVHQSDEHIDVYIACGDITGTPTDGTLEIELMELDGSGYSGTAMLVDNGDGTTTVTVNVIQSVTDATPGATPAS